MTVTVKKYMNTDKATQYEQFHATRAETDPNGYFGSCVPEAVPDITSTKFFYP